MEEAEWSSVFGRTKPLVAGACSDILQWWRDHRLEFAALSDLARNAFCMMAASTAGKLAFGMAGHVMTRRRANLQ